MLGIIFILSFKGQCQSMAVIAYKSRDNTCGRVEANQATLSLIGLST